MQFLISVPDTVDVQEFLDCFPCPLLLDLESNETKSGWKEIEILAIEAYEESL